MSDFQMGVVFVFGCLVGSFLNVCIYRLPRRLSVVRPGSHCPRCKTSIQMWENIPILSYLILRGRCRTCKAKIPLTYPLVEAITGTLLVLIWQHYGLSLSFVHYSILTLLLLPISFIDMNTKLILNVLTLPGIVAGLVLAAVVSHITVYQSLLGLLLGGGFLWLVGLVGETLFKQESMGGGDIKLGAMIGAFLGPEVLVALFLAFFLALPVIAIGLGTKRLQVGSKLAFGPFISLAAVIIVCFGESLYYRYFELLRGF